MNLMERFPKNMKLPRPSKTVITTAIVIVGVGAIVFGAGAAIRIANKGRVMPNVTYAAIDLSGMDRLAATQRIQNEVDAMLKQGLNVTANGETQTIALQTDSDEVAFALLDIDVNAAADTVFAAGRENGPIGLLESLWLATFGKKHIDAEVKMHTDKFAEAVRAAFPDIEDPGVPADFAITIGRNGNEISIVEPVDGKTFDFAPTFAAITEDAKDLRLQTATVNAVTVVHPVSKSEAEALIDEVINALAAAPYTLSYTPDTRTEARTWELSANQLSEWFVPQETENGVILSLDPGAMEALLTELHTTIDIEPENARFAMENNKAIEFAPSHDGVTVNDEQTIDVLAGAFGIEEATVMIVVDRVAPEITTANVNNLGIKEPLGTGVSSYGGSPGNRIINIRNGMEKLNGMLVAPGETISLIDKLGPFTTAAGYLPELVIKGDEIKPEIGGGLCQIGSTTFRAVMNAGLKVVERRNHSLVVSYYNDLSNGNPGTDATIYDPSPDFKFQNDTQNYVLLVTEMDESEKMLYFTFWGTSDGRKGSYEPPQVLSWTGYGATQYKETDSLAPGVKQCQAPHPGATTTFTYTVDYADGTKHEEEFYSSYRSLPQICLVGKSDDTSTEGGDDGTDSGDSEADVDQADEAVPLE